MVSAIFEFSCESLQSIAVLIPFVYKLMIGGSKNNRDIIRENAFEHKRKKLGLVLNPGLSANRLSNNWAQGLS